MSFLIDPPWLYANGRLIGAAPPEHRRPLQVATIALFWGVSVPLYLDRTWTRPIWRLCRARSGRDWMLNSGILDIDERRAGRRVHALSAMIFLTYPFWLWLGTRHASRR